jgi:hypothetical protein
MNKHTIIEDTVIIHVVQRNGTKHEVLVDLLDWEFLKDYSICVTYSNKNDLSTYRAMTTDADGVKWYLHRLLLLPPEDLVVDHENTNGLDNRRFNLRICTHAENQQNRTENPDHARGVSWYPKYQQWLAKVTLAGKQNTLGYFKVYTEAVDTVRAFRATNMPFSKEARQVNF